MIAFTVCSVVVTGAIAVIIVSVWRPDIDTSSATRAITGVINTLIGLLAGFLAGRTDAEMRRNKEDNG